MTNDTRDALLNAVLAELSSLRDYGAISDDNGYGTLSTTFVREHCDRIETALRTPRPESDARDAARYRYLRDTWGRFMDRGENGIDAGISTPSWRGQWDTFDDAIDAAIAPADISKLEEE